MSRTRSWMLRLWRLLALMAAAWLLHVSAEKNETRFKHSSISVEQAARFFPEAFRVSLARQTNGIDEVFDVNDRLVGFVTTTSPQADSVIGYAGPNNVLVGINKSGKIIGMELVASGDTTAHVRDVKGAEGFWKRFVGWVPSRDAMPKIDGVAGSTLTSLGIAEAVQKRLAGRAESLRFPDPLTIDEIRSLFPDAAAFEPDQKRVGWNAVTDKRGQLLGFAVRTSPYSDYTHGHSGPTESLLAVTPDGQRLTGIRLRKSYDTDEYADSVREDAGYLKQLSGFSVAQWAVMDLKKAGLEGVSGATETSFAVAEGIQKRFAADLKQEPQGISSHRTKDWVLGGIVLGSIVMTFSSLRGKRWVRFAWQAILIGVFGLWCGDLLSLALLAGWAKNGLAWQLAPSLVALGAVALLVPWATRQQVYCYQLCPHGAAQEWLGRFKKLHLTVPGSVMKYLRTLPWILLCVAFLIALSASRLDLAKLEAFDAWTLRGTALAATVIAITGLVFSLFVPMAYCRFGCPTGALLRFMRITGASDRFGARDIVALVLLIIGAVVVFAPRHVLAGAKTHSVLELHGKAFGTTWSVKFRESPKNVPRLQREIDAELERIESTLSHWRTNSATSQFNSLRTTQAIELPAELIALVSQCLEISRASDGAFDITVGPLVKAWGFGPGTVSNAAPASQELTRIRAFTGWQKLIVDTNDHTLKKLDPALEIDLGAILQGYAADHIASILNTNQQGSYLIDVGGELLAKGEWRVAIENPEPGREPLRNLILKDGALATSGTYRAKHTEGKRHWSHIIDPVSGQPVQHETALVSVMHPSCAMADAWATTLIVAGGSKAELLARENHLGLLVLSGTNLTTVNFPSK